MHTIPGGVAVSAFTAESLDEAVLQNVTRIIKPSTCASKDLFLRFWLSIVFFQIKEARRPMMKKLSILNNQISERDWYRIKSFENNIKMNLTAVGTETHIKPRFV